MAERVYRALKGEKGMRECSFVYMPDIEGRERDRIGYRSGLFLRPS